MNKFQNELVSKDRRNIDSNSLKSFANRDLLPRVCLRINYSQQKKYVFKVDVIFNDFHQTAQSTLVETNYKFKLFYLVDRNKQSLYSEFTNINSLYHVESTLIISNTELISANDMIEFNNLKQGVYFIEVI